MNIAKHHLDKYRGINPGTPTKAVDLADKCRDLVFLGDGVEKIIAPDYAAVVYLYSNRRGQPCAVGFTGRAKKPRLHYYYRTVESRDELVADWLDSIVERKKSRRKSAERLLKVGDVLVSSWGYEQTNIDYYLVTKLVGKASVDIVKIGKETVDTEWAQGKCVPDPTNIIGEPFRKRADGNSVKIASYARANLKEPVETVEGIKYYKPDHWTAYA